MNTNTNKRRWNSTNCIEDVDNEHDITIKELSRVQSQATVSQSGTTMTFNKTPNTPSVDINFSTVRNVNTSNISKSSKKSSLHSYILGIITF